MDDNNPDQRVGDRDRASSDARTRSQQSEDRVRLAVLSLMPDLGHVVPLLKIARVASEAGHEVRCFVPDDARDLVAQFGLPATLFPSPRCSRAAEVLGQVSALARWPETMVAGWLMADDYIARTHLAILERLEAIRETIENFAPDVVLADDHVAIRDTVLRFTAALERPLCLHAGYGSRFEAQSDAVQAWGLPERWWKRFEVHLNSITRSWYVRWLRIFKHDRWREGRDRRLELRSKAKSVFLAPAESPDLPECVSFTTGLGVLEGRYLRDEIRTDDHRVYLGPVDPVRSAALPSSLEGWLTVDRRPVVLVSFGTMLYPDPEEIEEIVEGVLAARARCLLLSKVDGDASSTASEVDLRVERFVPQPAVLAHPNVRAFVTHCGSNGVLEALWTSVPVLGIPLRWDQPYNASVIERLGAGIRVPRARVNRRRIEEALRSLLQDPKFVERVNALSKELKEARGGPSSLRLIEAMAGYSK